MADRDLQARIDDIRWYHEFDFGAGLTARSREPDVELHRRLWRFTETQLAAIDFRDKSVLDIGAWDGYWSFFAERRGAGSVLATDDLSQNWSDGRGLRLAKELLRSNVEIRQDISVYDLSSLQRRFDVVMCFGVYYHLLDPFLAFARIRHCCHRDSLVLVEGDVGLTLEAEAVLYQFRDPTRQAFLPSAPALQELLAAAYLQVRSQAWLHGLSGLAGRAKRRLLGARANDRVFWVCAPFEGRNDRHHYEPPFGLKVYDERFRT